VEWCRVAGCCDNSAIYSAAALAVAAGRKCSHPADPRRRPLTAAAAESNWPVVLMLNGIHYAHIAVFM